MAERCWILVGMMGAGKSAVGRDLACLAQREFWDTDLMLQRRVCHSIPTIFRLYGEDTFRAHETTVLRGLSPGAAVLSTGGGIVTRPENWAELRRLGTVAYLRASPEGLIARLSQSRKRRPLLLEESWEEDLRRLLARRAPLYEQADVILDVDGLEIAEAAARLKERFESWT
ncbi:MAG: shikimate kinase [Fimbriimonadaceae bacterium]|nr:shikimate kinase [Fimbriimonadaceae bacterium]